VCYIFCRHFHTLSHHQVKQVTHIPTGKLYAMKVLEKSHLIRHKKESTASAEKNALARLGKDHPGVIHLHWTFQDKRRLCELYCHLFQSWVV
jgi:3-phosphoinositide dependent protein kinase-1